MEFSQQLVEKVEVKKFQQVNKVRKVDGGTLEGTSHEGRQAKGALNTMHRAR